MVCDPRLSALLRAGGIRGDEPGRACSLGDPDGVDTGRRTSRGCQVAAHDVFGAVCVGLFVHDVAFAAVALQCVGQRPPVHCIEAKRDEKSRFGTAVRMLAVQQIIDELVVPDEQFVGPCQALWHLSAVRQFDRVTWKSNHLGGTVARAKLHFQPDAVAIHVDDRADVAGPQMRLR